MAMATVKLSMIRRVLDMMVLPSYSHGR
jgi:hypothetical protein